MNKKWLKISICLTLLIIFSITCNLQLVLADSGFDSSYDIDIGGDYGGGDGDGIFLLIRLIYLCIKYPPLAVVILIICLLIYLSEHGKKIKFINNAINNNKLNLLDETKYKDDKKIEIEAFNILSKIQYAWMNFDEETIRKYTTDEMYNMYLMQMDTLKVKNEKNIMYDIQYSHSYIDRRYEENGEETIVINMQIYCYDFIINQNSNKLVRGNISRKIYNYELIYVKRTDNKETTICPRCSAPVEVNNSGVCEYCRSTIVSNNYTLILSKKRMRSQK